MVHEPNKKKHYFLIVWLLAGAASLIAGVTALMLFAKQAPALDVDITFSREQAVQAATALRDSRFPALEVGRRATHFGRDTLLQNYVELEAGGLDAFSEILQDPTFAPFAWNVRLFTAGQHEELSASFSPVGAPLSYRYVMPQNTEGAALGEQEARTIAEQQALAFLGESFNEYDSFSVESKTQPNGRVDHTFTYQHRSLKLGESQPRMELEVNGDRLVRLHPYNYIPEEFSLRFEKMRELNHLISQYSTFALAFLFVLCGLIPGAIWLVRSHQLKWLSGAKLALVIAAGMAAAKITSLPLHWVSYKTTDTLASFLQQFFMDVGIAMVASVAVLASIYAVAEGLSRKAFASHPKLFSSLEKSNASSYQVLARIGGGYVWTGFFLLYAVAFIMFMQAMGGWSPRQIGADPNILASWRPALGPIFQALNAGTWEECLFRAIPLSGALIIGRHLGKVKLFVGVTLIVQALVFAGAHANYPQIPGYSRLLELFIPAMVFGLVFLRFGLIPCIVAHFLYDLVLMSSPLFTAQAEGLWLDRIMVVAVGFAPLLICVAARLRTGAWHRISPEGLNSAQEAQAPSSELQVDDSTSIIGSKVFANKLPNLPTRYGWSLLVIGTALLIAGLMVQRESPLTPFNADREKVLQQADAVMAEYGVTEEAGWLRATNIEDHAHEAKRFVWYEAPEPEIGKADFIRLLGAYLDQPYWTVTYRRFSGPVEQRQERWKLWMTPNAEIITIAHQLADGAPGVSLGQASAIRVARERMAELGWAEQEQLELMSAQETKRPERTDWYIEFADRNAYDHKDAYASIWFSLAGEEIVGQGRSIKVPEQYQRDNAAKAAAKTPWKVLQHVSTLGLVVAALFGYFFRRKNRGQFLIKAPLLWCLLMGTAFLTDALLWQHQSVLNFITTVSLTGQKVGVWVGMSIAALLIAMVSLLALQPVYNARPNQSRLVRDLIWGLAFALAVTGVKLLLWRFLPTQGIPTLVIGEWGSSAPWLSSIAKSILALNTGLILIAVCAGIAHFLRGRWQVVLVSILAVGFLVGQAFAGWNAETQLIHNALFVLSGAGVVYLAIHKEFGIILSALGFYSALLALNTFAAQFPHAALYSLLSALVSMVVVALMVAHWYRPSTAPVPQTASELKSSPHATGS